MYCTESIEIVNFLVEHPIDLKLNRAQDHQTSSSVASVEGNSTIGSP